ncbi:DUF1097 domain-containing protein [Cupriavidus sp. 8B]
MQPIIAYALAGSVISSLTVWGFLQFPGLLVWAAFIGWASFHHCGADKAAVRKSLTCNVYGVLIAWLVGLLVAGNVLPVPVPVAAALWVAIATPLVIVSGQLPALNAVPASFYGFASTFAFLVQTPGKFSVATMTSAHLDNALVVVALSLVAGNLLGWLQVKVGTSLLSGEQPAIS